MILRSRFVLPISRPPIENGAVRVAGSLIDQVGTASEVCSTNAGEICDLGEMILMPGLINAHCHLDYTEMAGKIPRPASFPDWIKALLALKSHWTYTDYARSWLTGSRMLLNSGVTTVADIEAVPELLPDVWSSTPLRVFSFLEMTGIRSGRPPAAILQEALDHIEILPKGNCAGGLSPHAPYSTTPELLQVTAKAAAERNIRITAHVSESREEYEMFSECRGSLFDWLRSQRNMSDCGHGSPIQHLERHGLFRENLLAVHVNYLGAGDAERLSSNGVSVAHCPRSHAYFRHDTFPLRKLTDCGVNICLGTDSLVSVVPTRRKPPQLSLIAEMQTLSSANNSPPSEAIVRMATQNGARALGQAQRIGELKAGFSADLIAIPYTGTAKDVYDAIVYHSGNVTASMINGIWVLKQVG
ncbi:MAG: amidohydrolase family protein [Verrucomicrobia bacterium]|nr:amidohydrolase family protein [Verrucomicrobiota bacterium]